MQLLMLHSALLQSEGEMGRCLCMLSVPAKGLKELKAAQLSSCGRKKIVTLFCFVLMRSYEIFGGGAFIGNILLLDF